MYVLKTSSVFSSLFLKTSVPFQVYNCFIIGISTKPCLSMSQISFNFKFGVYRIKVCIIMGPSKTTGKIRINVNGY